MPDKDENGGKPALSYRTAMVAYAVLGILCLSTLHGDPLYLCLLIIGAIAFKTWLARAKSRLEDR
jgi:hypothetical protein